MSDPITFAGDRMRVRFADFGIDSYRLFLACKKLPESRVEFCPEDETYTIDAPARFASMLGATAPPPPVERLPLPKFLYDDQREIVPLALDAKRFACWLGCGGGKGLPPATPVLTPGGWQPIGSLRFGDLVIGADGEPTAVEGVFHRGVQPLFRVTFSDGTGVVCDADHLWSVRTTHDIQRGKPWRTMSTRDLAGTRLKYGQHGQSRTWQIPLCASVSHPKRDFVIHPYVLGILLGDGSLGTRPCWCKPDVEVVERVRGLLPAGCSVSEVETGDRTPCWGIVSTSATNPVWHELQRLGLAGLRSPEKFVPEEYLLADHESRLELLRGLLDTDGCAGHRVEFCSTSRALAEAVVSLVRSLGGVASVNEKVAPKYSHNGEPRTGLTAYRVYPTMPAGINPFFLPRKASRFRTPSRGLGRWIDAIEPCGEGETVCIKVAAADGLFVMRDYVVTHNTLIGLEWGRQVSHLTGGGRVLIVTFREIIQQWITEAHTFYRDRNRPKVFHAYDIEHIVTRDELRGWMKNGQRRIAITNYEKFNPASPDDQVLPEAQGVAGVVLDEGSRLRTPGGKQKWALIKSFDQTEYKLILTATPAPNDLFEFTSQAGFLNKFVAENSINAFFSRDEKSHRWVIRPHAREAFYAFLATWSVYVQNPKRFGWRIKQPDVPKPTYHVVEIPPTEEQLRWRQVLSADPSGQLDMYGGKDTNAVQRNRLSQIAKGFRYAGGKSSRKVERIPSNKPAVVADIVRREAASGAQVLVWTVFDAESDLLAEQLGGLDGLEVLSGKTKSRDRVDVLDRFQRGRTRVLISKAKLLGWGMNFQCCTAMVFSGFSDSFEAIYQAIRRAVRHGQTESVRVYFPIIRELEGDTFDNLQRKEERFERSIWEMEDNYLKARAAR